MLVGEYTRVAIATHRDALGYRHHLVHHAHGQSLLGCCHLCKQAQLLCDTGRNCSSHELSPVPRHRDAQLNFVQADLGTISHDTIVAAEGDAAASSRAPAHVQGSTRQCRHGQSALELELARIGLVSFEMRDCLLRRHAHLTNMGCNA